MAFPDVDGVLPVSVRQSPNDWGLGFEIRETANRRRALDRRTQLATGRSGSSGSRARSCGVDPDAGAACVVLSPSRDFGP